MHHDIQDEIYKAGATTTYRWDLALQVSSTVAFRANSSHREDSKIVKTNHWNKHYVHFGKEKQQQKSV